MKRDIILAGVGGQGIITIASVIGYAAVQKGLSLKQSEVHGMSQRGGEVQSHLRIADHVIYSDLIPEGKADMIISIEPMEALRYVSFLGPEGWIITNNKPFINVPNYPDLAAVHARVNAYPRSILIDAERMAREASNARAANIVMIGAASTHVGIPTEDLVEAIKAIFARKGDAIVQANLRAFELGKKFAEEHDHAMA
jgi:indolepyruvate ferredoxin oxidoreductase, beta subunit